MQNRSNFLYYIFILSFSLLFIVPTISSSIISPISINSNAIDEFSGQINIPAGDYYVYNNTWNENKRVFVSYSGISGGNKDVIVHVVDAPNFELFKKSMPFVTIQTFPKLAGNSFEFISTTNKTYFFIFSNQFSFVSDKSIQISITWIPENYISQYYENLTFQLSPKSRFIIEFEYYTNTSIALDIEQGGAQGSNTMDIYILNLNNLVKFLKNETFSKELWRIGYPLIDEQFKLDNSGKYFLVIQASPLNTQNLNVSFSMDFPNGGTPIDNPWIGTIPLIIGVIAIFVVLVLYIIKHKQSIGQNVSYQKKYQALSKSTLVTTQNNKNISDSEETSRFTPTGSPDDEPKFCPFCGSEVSLTLRVCPFCKAKLE